MRSLYVLFATLVLLLSAAVGIQFLFYHSLFHSLGLQHDHVERLVLLIFRIFYKFSIIMFHLDHFL